MTLAWERFYEAVRSLASWGSIQERLANTYIYYLGQMENEEIPEEVRENFLDLRRSITAGREFGDGSIVRETVGKMSKEEAFEHAEKIIDIYDNIARQEGPM
jgi:HEPN domain-containing protein